MALLFFCLRTRFQLNRCLATDCPSRYPCSTWTCDTMHCVCFSLKKPVLSGYQELHYPPISKWKTANNTNVYQPVFALLFRRFITLDPLLCCNDKNRLHSCPRLAMLLRTPWVCQHSILIAKYGRVFLYANRDRGSEKKSSRFIQRKPTKQNMNGQISHRTMVANVNLHFHSF